MKRVYRLLVILMGFMIFMAVYLMVERDRFSNLSGAEQSFIPDVSLKFHS